VLPEGNLGFVQFVKKNFAVALKSNFLLAARKAIKLNNQVVLLLATKHRGSTMAFRQPYGLGVNEQRLQTIPS
jgi:hypothetical protein